MSTFKCIYIFDLYNIWGVKQVVLNTLSIKFTCSSFLSSTLAWSIHTYTLIYLYIYTYMYIYGVI